MLFRFSDVKKSFGSREILRGVSFQVNPYEKIGLVGRNGAGKTTIFRLVTGEESSDEGDVFKMNNLKFGLLEQHVDFQSDETVHTAALSSFKEIHDIEAEMRLLEKRMETDHSVETLEKYADLQIMFEQAEGFTYAARAESVLIGLGFTKELWGHDTSKLSGGQKSRLGLARLLLSSPDILLLDEPTNHLDVIAVEWLENFLQAYAGAYMVISHDRYFLDRTTNKIVEIDRGEAVSYNGNYSKYLVERELRREQQQREYENQQAFISKTEEFVRRNLEGQKTKQAKSRRNMLQRMDLIEAVTADRSGGNFGLKAVERAGNNILTTEEVAVGYASRTLAADININLHRGETLGIIGGNGSGKTTLLRTFMGEIRELSGKVMWGTKTNIGYYAQNLEDLDPRNEIIQELRRVAPLAEAGVLRSFLARFLFVGDDVFKSVGDLSGGEKGRLALAKLIYSQKNVLILDEPTNHLDIPSREALEAALDEYSGTIITVSHDRFFLDKVATQILSIDADGSVDIFNGNFTEYHDWKAEKSSRTIGEPTKASTIRRSATTEDIEPLSKNQRQLMKQRIREIEGDLPVLEESRADLTNQISAPKTASDPVKLQAAAESFRKVEEQIQELYSEWERLQLEIGE
ncbi:MAG: ABC-F family ATP-binding cassette domain-containing protein [Pyrinomonadaceae bacterium]